MGQQLKLVLAGLFAIGIAVSALIFSATIFLIVVAILTTAGALWLGYDLLSGSGSKRKRWILEELTFHREMSLPELLKSAREKKNWSPASLFYSLIRLRQKDLVVVEMREHQAEATQAGPDGAQTVRVRVPIPYFRLPKDGETTGDDIETIAIEP